MGNGFGLNIKDISKSDEEIIFVELLLVYNNNFEFCWESTYEKMCT